VASIRSVTFYETVLMPLRKLSRVVAKRELKYKNKVTVHAENKAFLCHCEAFRPKQSQKRTILDCFASLAMTKMRFPRERLQNKIIRL